MTKQRPQNPLNPQIRAEASEWLLRFSEGEVDPASREEFNYWLWASPEHVRAYLRISAFWQEAGHMDGKQGPRDIDALVAQAASEANVFPLALGPHYTDTAAGKRDASAVPPKARPALPIRRRFIAVAATLVAAVGAIGTYEHLTRNIYETRVGEQRTVNLIDGSTLILNADSRVKVRYSATERSIELIRGQALFKVAKNPARPFVVLSGDASVRAVGTQFDVYRKSLGTTVTVVEGKVAVTSEKMRGTGEDSGVGAAVEEGALAGHSKAPLTAPYISARVFLTAGEQLTIPKINLADADKEIPGATTGPQVRRIKVEEATAWTEGLLIFDGTPLTEVIQEFNRQNSKPLVLQGAPELTQIKITGTFPANGAERITRFLEERFNLVAHETGDHIALTRQ